MLWERPGHLDWGTFATSILTFPLGEMHGSPLPLGWIRYALAKWGSPTGSGCQKPPNTNLVYRQRVLSVIPAQAGTQGINGFRL